MKELVDMTAKRYGAVVAIRKTGTCKNGNAKWAFACDCGNMFIADGYAFRSGRRKACPACASAAVRLASVKHGMSDSAEFRIWTGMLTRCNNQKSKSYPNYGGRGITVCPEWRESFNAFYEAMGPRPSARHSIDRIDPDGHYEPSNCRWATPEVQANNTRANVRYGALQGASVSQAAKALGLTYGGLRRRLTRGKPDYLTKPNKLLGSITFMGVTDTLDGWHSRTGIKPSTIAMRLNRYGWTIEMALTKKGHHLDLHKL